MNQSPLEESPKSEHGDQPEWSVATQDQDHSTEDSNGGNDSERLSVESAEDALVVIGSPEHCDDSAREPPDTQPVEDSPPTSPPSSPLAIPPSMPFPPMSPTSPSPPLSSTGTVIQPPHMSSADITDSHSSTILASSPPVCPPSVQVPAAIFNDHALLQFSEVTQATIPPNVDLLSSPQVHYTESFGLIPEPFPRLRDAWHAGQLSLWFAEDITAEIVERCSVHTAASMQFLFHTMESGKQLECVMFASCTMSHSPPRPPPLRPDPLMQLINWILTAICTVCAISISKITDSKHLSW
ncbi:hypothetical protein C7M84_023242 [Penaeus vannamei]|uniref:Uncharacterized protein n=1 Tax=Penaeus vannamei TaxID=6689 RepID=A0A3R7QYL8_PENVA|nr:hypothetical protein C7M84_023242 [Penaeus vannamei]